ncbi:MAG: hypothetical protein IH905_12955, partial [Proteobacteria bacterium]|nr:hypothetical protein [Pseudomonadota bacterium]
PQQAALSRLTRQLGLADRVHFVGFRSDVIVAYWLGCFFTTRELRALQEATGAPLVWYMMDMAPFTGGCHYAFDCRGYETACGNCPAVNSKSANDVSSRTLARRRSDTEAMDITFVAASTHTADQCRNSAIGRGKRTEVIPIFVDPHVFRPEEKKLVRDKLGHKTLAMTGRYVNRDEDPLRELSEKVEGRIDAALSGNMGAEVVALDKKSGVRS